MKALLAAGVAATAVDAAGNGATHMAARAGDASLVKLLLRKVRTHTMRALPPGSPGRRALPLCLHSRSGALAPLAVLTIYEEPEAQLHAIPRAC